MFTVYLRLHLLCFRSNVTQIRVPVYRRMNPLFTRFLLPFKRRKETKAILSFFFFGAAINISRSCVKNPGAIAFSHANTKPAPVNRLFFWVAAIVTPDDRLA